jgi:hypothetical protein
MSEDNNSNKPSGTFTPEKIGNSEIMIPIEKHGVKLLSLGFFVDPGDARRNHLPGVWIGRLHLH